MIPMRQTKEVASGDVEDCLKRPCQKWVMDFWMHLILTDTFPRLHHYRLQHSAENFHLELGE